MVEQTHLVEYAAQLDAARVCTNAWIVGLHDGSCVMDVVCVCNLLDNKIRIFISSTMPVFSALSL